LLNAIKVIMSGVHQTQEQNERIISLMAERSAVEERSAGESPIAAAERKPRGGDDDDSLG
jgi:hypothetical protein